MKKECLLKDVALVATHLDVVCFDFLDRFLFSESNCRNKKQAREVILNSQLLQSISYCLYKGKRYSMSEIYSL